MKPVAILMSWPMEYVKMTDSEEATWPRKLQSERLLKKAGRQDMHDIVPWV